MAKARSRGWTPQQSHYRKAIGTYKKSYPVKKQYNGTYKPAFAVVSYARNVDKKYSDRNIVSDFLLTQFGNALTTTTTNNLTGVQFRNNTWAGYNNNAATGPFPGAQGDLLKGVATGTTTYTRVGNKVKPIYLKGTIMITANTENVTDDQGGEEVVNSTVNGSQYLRTQWRICIVKDTQTNSTNTTIKWDDVFRSGQVDTGASEFVGGVMSELNVDNMGRFIILEEFNCMLDADDPMKAIKFMISGSKIGPVRYNGPSATALTDVGVYVIASNLTMGTYDAGAGNTTAGGMLSVNSRFCFTDE